MTSVLPEANGNRCNFLFEPTINRSASRQLKQISTNESEGMTRRKIILFYSVATVVLLAIFSVIHLWAAGREARPDIDRTPRTPVLIELFTSEGCSDCPAADALLDRLDRSHPVNGAEIVVLSEHVDYWNGIGWKDPYSSHEYSERQNAYAGLFGLGSVYTPQMVVDGRFEFVGSDERRAIQAVERATGAEKIAVNLSSIHLESNQTLTMHIDVGQLPSSSSANSASVLLAIADERDESHVSGGENGGRTLKHVAVVRSLTKVGTVDQSDKLSQDLTVNLGHGGENLKLVALVQEEKTGRIWGVGSARFSN